MSSYVRCVAVAVPCGAHSWQLSYDVREMRRRKTKSFMFGKLNKMNETKKNRDDYNNLQSSL